MDVFSISAPTEVVGEAVTTSAASAATAGLYEGRVQVLCTVLTFFRAGKDASATPTAVTTDFPLAANKPYEVVLPGPRKLAFIGSAGVAYVHRMA